MGRVLSTIRFGDVVVRPAAREVSLNGVPAALGARAFDVLMALIERSERIVSKHELLDLVWPGTVVEENNLQVHISALRKALGPKVITTIPGRGYRFTAALDHSSLALESTHSFKVDAGPASPSNLPAHLPAIIGREDDIETVQELLRRHALVSLVSAGGIGKTRLALAVAETQCQAFDDGVWWVELAAVVDPAMVPQAVTHALGATLTDQRPAEQVLVDLIAGQRRLIVLDSCEHVLSAVSTLAESLLRRCSKLQLLVTSQETLKLPGEQAYRVPSLAVPAKGEAVDPETGAVALFITRAREADPRLVFDSETLKTTAEICRALDGIPLAIELAAARVPVLGVGGLHERLNERFRILTGGARKVLRRHQTLRAALEWSHGLLSEEERVVFRRLGVFSGGFPLELAQAVTSDSQIDAWAVLDVLGHLVDKSLVVAEGTERPRYRLLETTHAFALEQLGLAGETASMLRRHAEALNDYLLKWRGPGCSSAKSVRDPTRAELDNLRSALDWAESPSGDRALACALMGVSVAAFSNDFGEGLQRCRRLLPVRDLQPEIEAHFQLTLARLGSPTAGPEPLSAATRAAELFRGLNYTDWLIEALLWQAHIGWRRQEAAVVNAALGEAERLIGPETPAGLRTSLCLAKIGNHLMRDELEAAHEMSLQLVTFAEGLAPRALANVNVATSEILLGRYEDAIARLQEALRDLEHASARDVEQAKAVLSCCYALRNEKGDSDRAFECGRDAFLVLRRKCHPTWLLFNMALVATRQGKFERAALVLGHTDAAYIRTGERPYPYLLRLRGNMLEEITDSLGEAKTAQLLATGGNLDNDQAAEEAFALT